MAVKPGIACKLRQPPVERGESLHDTLKLILVDAEMPEMDGYVLTRLIKNDPRFLPISRW